MQRMKSYTHSTGTYIGKGGVEIFYQCWTVERPRAVVVIAHGVGEHSGRYGHIINAMSGAGVSFYAIDHRGHGKSGGKMGHVESFMEYVYDLKLFMNFVKEDAKNAPLFMMGHSMGGVIALKYALTYPEDIDALIASSAGMIPAVEIPKWKESLGLFFSKHLPGFTMPSGLPSTFISHDMEIVRAYDNDPLVHDKVSARWYTEFLGTGQECLARASELRMPLLVFHGTGDQIVDFKGSDRLFQAASSKDKSLHLFEGLYHETMNETPAERAKVLDVVSKWIMAHCTKGASAAAKKKPATVKPVAKKKGPAKKAASKKSPAKKKPAQRKPAAKKASVKKKTAKKSGKRK